MTAINGFDQTKAYQPQEEGTAFFDDGREIQLLHFIYSHAQLDQIRGSPTAVLAAIDEYGRTQKYLMNAGDTKGKIVCDLIAARKPKIMVELGGYIGYSAILFGNAVREAGGQRLYSLERNPEFAAVISSLVDLAGLSDIVKVVVGGSAESIARLHKDQGLREIHLLFLDHYKPAYTTDLKLCEALGMIRPGTVLAADNVIKPGNPPYLEYVRSSVATKRSKFDANTNTNTTESSTSQGSINGTRTDDAAGFDDRYKKMYENRVAEEKLDGQMRGNPNLVYESQLINSFEPTGVPDGIEVTHCVGEESR